MPDISDFYIYLFMVYAIAIVVVVLYVVLRHRGKVEVRIRTGMGWKSRWKRVEADGRTIWMERPRAKTIGWKFTFDEVDREGRFFKHDVVYIIHGANVAITYNLVDKVMNQPTWDRPTAERLFEASVIKSAGLTGQRLEIPMVVYVLLIMILGVSAVNILLSQGVISVGGR